MKRFKRFLLPPTALAEQQALSWISKITSTELSQKQEAEFAVWLSLDTSHRRLIDELIDIWEITGDLSPVALQRITHTADQAKPSQAELTPASASPQPATPGVLSSWFATLRQRLQQGPSLPVFGFPVAAVVVAALVLVWASLNDGSISRLYETNTGGYAKIALEDGSILHLNTNTRVKVYYTPGTRQLQLLSGELFIKVAKDAQRPLTVYTETFSATAIGTAFGVAATPAQHWVEVAQGEVLVRNTHRADYLARGDGGNARQQALLAGEKLQIDEEFSSLDLSSASAQHVASWRGGQLFYRDVPLRDLIADLNRYHRQQLVVHDSELGDIRLSAVLNSNDYSGAVAALSSSLGLVPHEIGDYVTLLAHKN